MNRRRMTYLVVFLVCTVILAVTVALVIFYTTRATTTTTTTTTPTMAPPTNSTQPMMPDSWANMTGQPWCPGGSWQLAYTSQNVPYCFLKVANPLSWSDASSKCHSFSSELLVLDDAYVEQIWNCSPADSTFRSYIAPYIAQVSTGQWVGVHLVQGKLWWEADVPIKVFSEAPSNVYNWAVGQPDGSLGDCGVVADTIVFQNNASAPPTGYQLSLALEPCASKKPFVCSRKIVNAHISQFDQLCPPGWLGSIDSKFCYYYDPSQLNFDSAVQRCRDKNATLVQPQDSLQNNLISIFFMDMNPYSQQNASMLNPESYWLGFTTPGNNTVGMTSVDGVAWAGSFDGFSAFVDLSRRRRRRRQYASNRNCVYFSYYNGTRASWFSGDCYYSRSTICQMSVLVSGPPKVTLNNYSPTVTIRQTSLNSFALQCNASYAHPLKPVVWVKDGIYVNNDLPPGGLNLGFTSNGSVNQLDIYNTSIPGLFQGYYRCEVWGIGTDRIASSDTLLTFEDVATFRGTVWLSLNWPTVPFLSVLNVTFWSGGFYDAISSLLNNKTFKNSNNVQIQLGQLDSSNTCCNLTQDFTAYYPYNISDASLTSLINYLQTQPYAWDPNWTVQWRWVLNERIYQTLTNSILASQVQTLSSSVVYYNTTISATIYDVKLHRTDGCEAESIYVGGASVYFPSTPFGEQAASIEQCLPPAAQQPVAKATCIGDFVTWGIWDIPDVSHCNDQITGPTSSVTDELLEIFKKNINLNNVNDLTSRVSTLTINPSILLPIDVNLASHILDKVAVIDKIPTNASDNFVSIVNNVMYVDDQILIEAQESSQAPIKLCTALGAMTANVNLTGLESFSSLSYPNLGVQVWNMSDDSITSSGRKVFGFGYNNRTNSYENYFAPNVSSNTMDSAIILSDEAMEQGRKLYDFLKQTFNYRDSLRASFIIYQKGNLFYRPTYFTSSTGGKYDVNRSSVDSLVVSGAFNGIPIVNLTDPIKIILWLQQNTTVNQVCAYLEYAKEEQIWGWSGVGLTTNYSSNDTNRSVVCYSTHLTNFAVLAGFDLPPDTAIARALQIISIIGLSISIAGLALTILAQILFREFRKGRSQMVLLHLALALLAVDIIVLAGVDHTSNYGGCCAVAALLHYFLLVSFLWMLVEAVIQYLKFVKVFDTYTPRFMLKAALPAWLIPAVIVGIVAAVNHDLFRGPTNYCWLAPDAFHFAFLLPLGLIMVTNLVLFILVIKGITCDRPKGLQSNQSQNKIMWLQVQAAIACFVVMGLTWLFAFFAIDGAAIVMQFLFCIFNSLQGFFIFIFLNIREKPVRQAWAKFFCRRRLQSKPIGPPTNKNKETFAPGSKASDQKSVRRSIFMKVFQTDSNSESSNNNSQTENQTANTMSQSQEDEKNVIKIGERDHTDYLRTESEIERTFSCIRDTSVSPYRTVSPYCHPASQLYGSTKIGMTTHSLH